MMWALLGAAWAATLSVPGDHASLADAVAAASAGDVIELGPGTWPAGVLIDKELTIRSTSGAAGTVLQGLDPLRATLSVVQATLTVEDLTVQCSPIGGINTVNGSTEGRGLRINACASARGIIATTGANDVTLVDSRFTTMSSSLPAIETVATTLTLEGVRFEASPSGAAPLVLGEGDVWRFTDVAVDDVHRSSALFEGSSLLVDWTRVSVSCSSAGPAVASIDSSSATIGPVLVWNTTTDSGGALLEVGAAGTWTVAFGTLVGTGAQELIRATGGTGVVESTAFAGSGVAIAGLAGSVVQGDWNAFEAGITPASGYASESLVRGSSSIDGEASFEAHDPAGDCGGDVLAPAIGSPLIDAGDPGVLDRNGTRSDIGATGGPEGFQLFGDDRDGDGFPDFEDCDPFDPLVHPGAFDVPYDGIDQDCDGVDVTDVDGDGFDAVAAGGDDCDDEDPAVSPGAKEDVGPADLDCDGHSDSTARIESISCETSTGPPAGWTPVVAIVLLGLRRRERSP